MIEPVTFTPSDPVDGVVVVDKPVGLSSFAVVRLARHTTGARKVGHGGTLDPLASGVLPICFGEATKLAQFLLDADKEYEATLRFGVETDTHDSTGSPIARAPADHLTEDGVRAALLRFLGAQTQLPPMYSALKRAGRPLYAYARAGQTVELAPRAIRIDELSLRGLDWGPPQADGGASVELEGPVARIFVRCSKGTYIRALARDIGRALGTVAHLAALRRTRSGPFEIARAISVDALSNRPLPVVALADALAHLPAVTVSAGVVRTLVRGQRICWQDAVTEPLAALPGSLPIRILDPGGALIAVARPGSGSEPLLTVRVFSGSLR